MIPGRYLRTIRHLKPVQIYGRLLFRIRKPSPSLAPAPERRPLSGTWAEPPGKEASLIAPGRFRLLNVERELTDRSGWNDPLADKLWLYNLHYFDDLTAEGWEQRRSWHAELIQRWISENPPAQGNGWEPYPLSLRIVNWIKWALVGNRLPDGALQSLAVQARHLTSRLEYHILGNHLLANAKALVFAGLFFGGQEAQGWLDKGLAILALQVPEQILADGGHFERSPMYHSIILEDLLDLINLGRVFPDPLRSCPRSLPDEWHAQIPRMQSWLCAMTHPDGEIALFNDAAFGVAHCPAELLAYSRRLGLPGGDGCRDAVTHLRESGYIRLQKSGSVVILDVGEVGPGYLPGHAHADTLSFEFSLNGQRLMINSGTSCYGQGLERSRQRSTGAHNTVVVDRCDSSEVWGGFRVGRRAKPFGLAVAEKNGILRVECSHDGYRYRPGMPVHRRLWELAERELTIRDSLSGTFEEAVAHFHFHPAARISVEDSGRRGMIVLPGGQEIRWNSAPGPCSVTDSTYHPRFGASEPNLSLQMRIGCPEAEMKFSW